MSNNLKIKDLVLIGVFTVIYFAVMFGVGMMGMIPILFLVYPIVLSIVAGPIIMLFMAKVQKPWALFILGMLTPIGMFFMGHTYIMPLHAFVIMITAELIRRIGGYSSFKYNMISYAIFSTWICGSLMQMIWARKKYIELSMMMGKDYVDKLEKLITYQNMALVYIGSIIGGVIGAYLGRALLKKHFEKAGII